MDIKKTNLILSIDGGGALGIGPAEYLRRADAAICPVRPHAYTGTSVGALLVALAAAGYAWGDVRDLFRNLCPQIFEKPSIWWRMNPCKPRYDGRALKALLQYHLGDQRMCDLPVPTFLTAFDFNEGRPKVFDCTDETPVWYAVLCSCAAPTYFPIVDGRYGDGGLVANNPAMVGIAGCVAKLGWPLDEMACLSFGTNGDAWTDPKVTNRGLIRWLRPLLDTFMTGNEEIATFQARALIGSRLLRIEPVLGRDVDLDDVAYALGPYRQVWARMFEAQRATMVPWVQARMKP